MTSRPIIKVCGMRETENIREVEALGIDWLGMIFWPKSKRYVATPPSYLPTDVKKVGVFVDASLEDICQHIHNYQLDIIQLHGSEHPEFLRDLRNTCGSVSTIKIIKAFNIATVDDLLLTESYAGLADYFLFDTKGKMVGGNGEQFDWSILVHYHGTTPYILSGGIGPKDAERVYSFLHDNHVSNSFLEHGKLNIGHCIGIDLNSRFETVPGLKDINKLKTFVEEIRK